MTSPSCDREEGSTAPECFFFAGVELGGPIEELRILYDTKSRTYEALGDRENAERFARAFELARAAVEAAMRRSAGAAEG